MKRLFLVFLAASFLFSAYVSYLLETDKEVQAWSAAAYADFAVTIPRIDLLGPDIVLSVLEEAATHHQVNLLRDVQLLGEGDKIALTTFALLTEKSPFLEAIPLRHGSRLTSEDTRDGDLILSSRRTKEDVEEIKGTIQTLSQTHTRTVRPLHQFPNYVSPYATYQVEQAGTVTKEQFSATLADLFNHYLEDYVEELEPLTVDDFAVQTEPSHVSTTFDPTFPKTLAWTLWGITGLMLMFYIMRNGKTVAIYSMHGFSLFKIWRRLIGNACGGFFAFYLLFLPLLAFALFGWQPRYLFAAMVTGSWPFLLLLAISFLFVFYSSRSSLIESIKNNTKTKLFLIVSQIAKVVALVSVIVFLLQIADRLTIMEEVRNSMTDWAFSKDYGEFYPHSIGYDQEEMNQESGLWQTDISLTESLYPVLNAAGALYIDAVLYEEEWLRMATEYSQEHIRSIRVNPNYLQAFPLVDENNKRIAIQEEETNRVLLVPEQYKDQKENIIAYFKENYARLAEIPEYQAESYSHLQEQTFDIIWLASSQEVFSFNLYVFPNEGNLIVDPIIQVLTENNSYPIEREFFRGSVGNDPLKVKLLDQNTAKTYEHYLPLLRDLQLDDNAKHLVTVNEQAQKDITEIQRALTLDTILFVLTATIALFMIVQSSHLLFAQHKKRFLLRRLFGHSLFRAYRNVLFWTLATWVVILGIALYRHSGTQYLAIVVLVLFLTEVVVTSVVLMRLEQKNKVSVLKGE
ncbi:bacteriocin-associated integral membrane family protein [Halalkalibacterium halodurans]|uniref:bacteriocin-associated integral membrane family protein n=1 Tax=Halalkalibacterium halodurans TaxID=86665 RepID=UPI002E21991D|nr:bacteriocin-associated integral membrane family protein [Halalkalibacterium halodurans]